MTKEANNTCYLPLRISMSAKSKHLGGLRLRHAGEVRYICDNTNIMAALVECPDKGCMRETFFMNQLRASGHELVYPPAGDFLVDGKHLFEIGGRKKSFAQIKDLPDSFLAVDDLEVGYGNRIPLWMFGGCIRSPG